MTIPSGQIGHYEIRSKIGEGGMGEVYLAFDTKLDRRVALKILPVEVATNQDRMRRFVQEAKTASGLNHPNIITIHEIDQTDSVHFIVTEFIDGVTLRQRMKSALMKLSEVLDTAIQTASALSAAHAAGIVHRDIKPENIMVRHDGIVKVLDFGLVKLTERPRSDSVDTEAPTTFMTDPGTAVGTVFYMSPEQARGAAVDERTDIFSLGVLIYEMIAGRLPFEGSNTNEILASILSDKELLPLARYAREVPAELERIVSKTLRKNRDERYQTVKDLALDLRSLRQQLEFDRKLERSVTPRSKNSNGKSQHPAAETIIRFGDFVLDNRERILTRSGRPVPLPPKALALLSVLVENRGHIVEKDDLIRQVGTDTFVQEKNLASTIRLLRKTLGDEALTPRFIETVPRRGYRFVAQCQLVLPTASSKKAEFGGKGLESAADRIAGGLIGREKELAAITEVLLTELLRLVTLTGPGGTGKTRLAKEVANQLEHHFPEGIFFIDLTAVTDPLLVAPAIAQQLGINQFGTKPILDRLSEYLREQSALLILDNFEQVVSAGVQLAQLLRNTNALKLLITSREPLKLTVETEYRVPPLAVPSHETKETIADVLRFGAVQLFVERAKTARRDLELSDKDAHALVGICTKLDGLPLALELAASRAKVLSVQEIFSKLEARLALLTGGSRDMPDRQRTMRATIEWSYGFFNEVEKRVFVLLSVFEGGFTFGAAEKVLLNGDSHGAQLSETIIIDAITSLSEKGLLLSEKSPDGQLRFRMLVVVRDYALEVRSQSRDADTISRSHAEYFLELAETAAPHLFSFQSLEWLNRLDPERDNIRAAIRWSLKNDRQMGARIIAAVRHLAGTRLHVTETRYWLEEALKKSHDLSLYLQCEMFTGLGVVCQYQRDLMASRTAHEQNLKISRRLTDKKLIARALRGIAAIDYMESDLPPAFEHISEALVISRSINDEFGEAAALARLGDLANAQRDYSKARSLITHALEIFRRLGFKLGVSAKLANLSITEFESGNYQTARQRLVEGLETCAEIGDEIDFRTNFDVAAALLVEAGDFQKAARLAGVAAARSEDLAYFHEPVEQRFRDTYLTKLKNIMPESEFDAAFSAGRKMLLTEATELALEAARG